MSPVSWIASESMAASIGSPDGIQAPSSVRVTRPREQPLATVARSASAAAMSVGHRPDLADWFVAGTGPSHPAFWHPDLDDPHPVLGERPRLVGADERRRPKGLHRLQSADECMLVGHPLSADRQREGHGGQEALGDERHGDADGEHESIRWRRVEEEGEKEEPGAGGHCDQGDRAYETMELTGQRCVGPLGSLGEYGDTGEVGGCSRRRHERSTFAFDHERAGPQVVTGADRVGDALTRERRGVDEQPVTLDACHVGRDPVAFGEHDEVAGNDALGDDHQRQIRHARRPPGAGAGSSAVRRPARLGTPGRTRTAR